MDQSLISYLIFLAKEKGKKKEIQLIIFAEW